MPRYDVWTVAFLFNFLYYPTIFPIRNIIRFIMNKNKTVGYQYLKILFDITFNKYYFFL